MCFLNPTGHIITVSAKESDERGNMLSIWDANDGSKLLHYTVGRDGLINAVSSSPLDPTLAVSIGSRVEIHEVRL